jgi:(5-formylfuran-3-yl)methyl phosphate transaminase
MPSKLSEELSPFYVMEVLERAQEIESGGDKVIHFEVGEPDFPTPPSVTDEALRAITEGDTKYTHSLGISELREAIAEDYQDTYGLSVSSERVVVTMGSSPALLVTMLSLIEPGNEVIITDPHYACYPQIIKVAGGVPKRVPISERDGFQIDTGRLKDAISKNTGAVLINSPANPTGAVLSPEVMGGIAGLGLTVISDEIYHGLTYGRGAKTIYEFTENAFVVNGFSKYYSMTGWRLGYLIVPPEYVRPVQKLQQNLFISANPFVQRGGVAALRNAKQYARGMVSEFDLRRKKMIEGVRELGFELSHEPEGAFYVFVNAAGLNPDSRELAFDILEKAHVAVTPGIDFGPGGEGYLRFSYAVSLGDIEEGIKRLGNYISACKGDGK